MKDEKILFAVFILLSIVLYGCWDDVEIEERAFLSAVAIDLAEDGTNEDAQFIEMTEQLVVPAGLSTLTQPGDGKAFRNLSDTGKGVFEINSKISKQGSRKLNVEHLGLIVVSREIAETDGMLKNVFDVFIREQYMRRGILVAVVEGKAKDILEVQAEHIMIPAHYVIDLLEKDQSSIAKDPVRIGDIHEKLLTNRSFALPLISILNDKVLQYEGIAVIAHEPSRMAGSITGIDAEARHIMIGKGQQSVITLPVEGDIATLVIDNSNSKYTLTNQDKQSLAFRIDIDLTASVKEYYGDLDLFKKENVEKFRVALENEVKQRAEQVLNMIKDEIQVDMLQIDDYLRIHHYRLWEEIKDDWDYGENLFSQSEIEIHVQVDIMDPGTSTKVN